MEVKREKLGKAEEQFLEHFEKHSHFEDLRKSEGYKEHPKETIKNFIKQLHKEIESLPEIREEAEIHHQSLEEMSNILANAINIALTEGLVEALSFIASTKNPHFIDAFHDLLAGHFFNLLVKHNKITLIK
ncbi:MAG: hypothetical protein NZ866_02895 [Patescibacteria group bacterium]|nr:hypothetical protein [Patescibacteria group bacterium]